MIRSVPWWLKLSVKVAASAAGVPYSVRKRLGFGRHGSMHDPEYAIGVVRFHFAALRVPSPPFHVLEIGPGDSTLTALVAAAAGSGRTWMVDVDHFASYDQTVINEARRALERAGLEPPELEDQLTFETYLDRLGAHYLTDGLRSLQQIPGQTIDGAWSHAVLEHVRRDETRALLGELRRVLVPGGRMSHCVDLSDHLSGGFDNLRIPSSRWERPLIWRSGAYTNRLSCSELLDLVTEAGFEIESMTPRHRHVPHNVRESLAVEFRDRSLEDLAISGFDVVARVPG